jgi:hypothetical protein
VRFTTLKTTVYVDPQRKLMVFLKAKYPFVDNKVVIITELREEGRP